jgi:hypothetical protein
VTQIMLPIALVRRGGGVSTLVGVVSEDVGREDLGCACREGDEAWMK